jgi:isopentenyl diphosphate isomerase/L-lactate dehydrogenase-like FMN-dependent dehydrogenase
MCLYCSNHGGRQANGGIAAVDLLPGIVKASCNTPVLFDSGIRSGTEVIKALALGAAAVGIGRPYAYGLALVKRRAFTATRAKPRPEFVSTYTGAKSGKQINESGHSNPLQR